MNELEVIKARFSAENRVPRPAMSSTFPGLGLKRDYAGLLEYWQMARRHKGAIILATFVGGAARIPADASSASRLPVATDHGNSGTQ